MDNFGKSNVGGDAGKPISLDDTSSLGVSHAPLNMGSSTAKAPAGPAATSVKPTVKVPTTAKGGSSSDRITGVKTFFTKLHPGAIEFLDEQIANWLKANPGVDIKLTNIVTGEIQGKKTEPNIIVTVWY
jgi:ABC-type glycerol-3-phosphate transport system substrate-binding protein